MAKTETFNKHRDEYEEWFAGNIHVYRAELRAVGELIPRQGRGVEIGVGTGRFAEPLGIGFGVEPSPAMAEIARHRGVRVVEGTAEKLPLEDESFDFALMVTTVCFVDDVLASFREARRILVPGGVFILGVVDRTSPVGRLYQEHKNESVFYREATFFSTAELVELLETAGFAGLRFRQTVFDTLDRVGPDEPVEEGYGRGSFVVIAGDKSEG